MSPVCGPGVTPPNAPEIGDSTCCMGAIHDGPSACTCWVPVFNAEQQPPDEETAHLLAAGIKPSVRPGGMCGNCAYRPDSPEKTGDPNYHGDADQLEAWAANGDRFWCHDGLLTVTEWVHEPSGTRIPATTQTYTPPQRDGVPYRTDGNAGYLCAGWDARRRALEASS